MRMRAAFRLPASTKDLLLDPVYGGKPFSGLVESVTSKKYLAGRNIPLVMTGSQPRLFAYLTCLVSSGHFNLGEWPRLLQLNNTAA